MARESVPKPRRNMPGIWRASLNPWLIRIQNHPERLAFVLHRVTGVIIILYLLAHVAVTMTPALRGWQAWDTLMTQFNNRVNQVGEFIVAGSVLFHAMNGIRLLITEFFGACLGRPERPKPPYIPPTYRACQRTLLYIVFALWPILWVFAGLLIFGVF